jgi:hypothetical protein
VRSLSILPPLRTLAKDSGQYSIKLREVRFVSDVFQIIRIEKVEAKRTYIRSRSRWISTPVKSRISQNLW